MGVAAGNPLHGYSIAIGSRAKRGREMSCGGRFSTIGRRGCGHKSEDTKVTADAIAPTQQAKRKQRKQSRRC